MLDKPKPFLSIIGGNSVQDGLASYHRTDKRDYNPNIVLGLLTVSVCKVICRTPFCDDFDP